MLKKNWETEELIENWTLIPRELELVRKKVGGNQIEFAVLLKYFQLMARFPDSPEDLPENILSYIANQLNIPVESYSNYNWQGRSAKVYRVEIRNLFNFKIATVEDSEKMSDWLVTEIIPNEQRIESITELEVLEFRSNNDIHRPLIKALELLKKYSQRKQKYYDATEEIPIEGVLKSGWREILLEKTDDGKEHINRINYEISVLQALRERLNCKEIWVVGASRYRLSHQCHFRDS